MDSLPKTQNIITEICAAGQNDHLNIKMFSELFAHLSSLKSKLSSGHQDYRCDSMRADYENKKKSTWDPVNALRNTQNSLIMLISSLAR